MLFPSMVISMHVFRTTIKKVKPASTVLTHSNAMCHPILLRLLFGILNLLSNTALLYWAIVVVSQHPDDVDSPHVEPSMKARCLIAEVSRTSDSRNRTAIRL